MNPRLCDKEVKFPLCIRMKEIIIFKYVSRNSRSQDQSDKFVFEKENCVSRNLKSHRGIWGCDSSFLFLSSCIFVFFNSSLPFLVFCILLSTLYEEAPCKVFSSSHSSCLYGQLYFMLLQ